MSKGTFDYNQVLPRYTGIRRVRIAGIRNNITFFVPGDGTDRNLSLVERAPIGDTEKVVFSASKQKGAERRIQKGFLVSHATNGNWLETNCIIPTFLCCLCPVCAFNGGTNVTKESQWKNVPNANEYLLKDGALQIYSTKGRTFYADSFSVEPASEVIIEVERNTVREATVAMTEATAIHTHEVVKPNTHFPFFIELLAPTPLELGMFLYAFKTVLSQGYGAATTRGEGKFTTETLVIDDLTTPVLPALLVNPAETNYQDVADQFSQATTQQPNVSGQQLKMNGFTRIWGQEAENFMNDSINTAITTAQQIEIGAFRQNLKNYYDGLLSRIGG